MALGATHYRWREDVGRVSRQVRERFPVTTNTYVNHPWSGWDGRSIDVWGVGGRGSPIPLDVGLAVLRYMWTLPGRPQIRHWIYLHTLWTSFGGESSWPAGDHSGRLRHVHVTYW